MGNYEKILEYINAKPIDQLRCMVPLSFYKICNIESNFKIIEEDIDRLVCEKIIEEKYQFYCQNYDEFFDISYEEYSEVLNGGSFYHPETGGMVLNPKDKVSKYWSKL